MSDRTVHPIEAHPIEVESYAILRSRVDLTAHPPLTRAVLERVIHASADLAYADDLVCDEPALRQGWTALHAGAPIVTDVAMVASGITSRRPVPPATATRGPAESATTRDGEHPPGHAHGPDPAFDHATRPQQACSTGRGRDLPGDPGSLDAPEPAPGNPSTPGPSALRTDIPGAAAHRPDTPSPGLGCPATTGDPATVRSAGRDGVVCRIGDPAAAVLAHERGITRSAAAVRLAADEAGPGAVWVIGCAPTALYEVITAAVRPALIIGLPVGFVGAAESKAALRDSGLPAVSNRGEKGGSAVAAAAVNALLYYRGRNDL